MKQGVVMMERVRQKVSVESGLMSDKGFPQMGAMHYLQWFPQVHADLKPETYFEIGTESGASLAMSSCFSIAVDPVFRLQADVSRNKPALMQFQMTSDAFFETGILGRLGRKIDLAFLDGMHLFEYLLRDFMNIEGHMNPRGMVMMHDCVPINAVMADRKWNKKKTMMWTGDVWKVVAILREYRPDLRVNCLDLAPTGVVVVENLDPSNRVLDDNYDEIVARFTEMSIDDYGVENLSRMIDLQPVGAWQRAGSGAADAVPARAASKPAIAVKACTPGGGENWGDTHFARSLAKAFERKGYGARVDLRDEWANAPGSDVLDIVVQGHDYHAPRAGVPALMWYIYPGKRFDVSNLALYRHVFVASEKALKQLSRNVPGMTGSYLPQAFDADIMAPSKAAREEEIAFVGNNHFGGARPVVQLALDAGKPFRIWGNGWDDPAAAACLVDTHIANDRLPGVYQSARAVLCDHSRPMRKGQFVSNRIYDALACAAPVISDVMTGMPAEFLPFVHQVDTQEDFEKAYRAIASEGRDMRARRIAFAESMRETDSFDARAETVLAQARKMGLIA